MVKTDLWLHKGIYYTLILYSFFSTISIAAGNLGTFLGSLLALILCLLYRNKITGRMPKNFFIFFGFFLLTFAISAVFSHNPSVAFKRILTNVIRMVPLFLTVFFIKNQRQVLVLVGVIAISITLSSSYAIWQGVCGNFRAPGFGSHPMILAGYLIQIIPLLLILSLNQANISQKLRYAFIGITLISLVALVFNGTRGAWIAIIFMLIAYFSFTFKKVINRKKTMIIILFIFIFFCGMLVTSPVIRDRFLSIVDLEANSERILLWKSALNMFNDHPLTGVGAGNFTEQYQTRYILPEAKERELEHAHNTFLHVLAETGIIGIIGFLCFFGYIIAKSIRNYKKSGSAWSLAAVLVTLSFFIQGLTEYNYGNSAVIRLYWMIIGLVFVATQEDKLLIDTQIDILRK